METKYLIELINSLHQQQVHYSELQQELSLLLQNFSHGLSGKEEVPSSTSPVYRQTVELLKQVNPDYNYTSLTLESLLNDIIILLPYSSMRIDAINQAKQLVHELHAIANSILLWRTDYSLMHDIDLVELTEEELSLLQNTATSRQREIKELLSSIEECKVCLESLEYKEKLIKVMSQLKRSNRELTANNKLLERQLKQYPLDCSNHPFLIEQESNAIFKTISDFLKITEQVARPPIVSALTIWNDKIEAMLHLLPLELSSWYKELFAAMQAAQLEIGPPSRKEDNYDLRFQHILRDIYFELEYPDNKGFEILQAYQQLCPLPSRDYLRLSEIKPAVPVDPKLPLASLENPELQKKLTKLYEQQKNLQGKHPREALLLLQATQNLHQIALNTNKLSVKAVTQIENCMQDPRYEPLQKHRGFLKVVEWLAEFCTTLLGCVKKQPEHTYRQRFFFTATHSIKLLTETAQSMINSVQ